MLISRVEFEKLNNLRKDYTMWLRVSRRIDGSVARQPRCVMLASRRVSRVAFDPNTLCSSIRRKTCVAEFEAA